MISGGEAFRSASVVVAALSRWLEVLIHCCRKRGLRRLVYKLTAVIILGGDKFKSDWWELASCSRGEWGVEVGGSTSG